MGFGSLSAAHGTLAWVALAGNGAAAVWALAAHRLAPLRGRPLWWFVALAQVLLAVEVALGVGLMAGQGRAVSGIHTFYGFITLAAVGILFSYRGHLSRTRRYLLYGWGGLFITGLVIRTMIIG
ncbi:MAG: hypothetical protein OXG55_03255 [bacterium]|nr:hypothetical protein [bacterium]MCY4102277.1 hypothetical protein [bacterium]